MTNEEAKEIMSKVTFYWELGEQTLTRNQIDEALDMAIKALEEISRLPENLHREREQAYMNGYADGRNSMRVKESAYDDAVERIEKSTFTLHDGLDCVETLVALEAVMIASAQTKPCEDAISRQKAIDAIDALYLDGDSSVSYLADAKGDTLIGKYQAITILDDLPSVTPVRPKGEWIFTTEGNTDHITCSICGRDSISNFDYCPNCGCHNSRI